MKAALGIDFGGTSVKFGVVHDGKVVSRGVPIPTQDFPAREDLIDEIMARILTLRSQNPEISAIGVGVPGFTNFYTGVITNLTNVPGWQNVPLKAILEKRTGLPVIVENDANAMAYAEWKMGAGRGYTQLVALTLGTGVGGGVIVNDQLVRGACGGAGELGQTSIDYKGRVGTYGNTGALESYIGNREIMAEAVRMYTEAGSIEGVDDLSPKALFDRALAGGEIALEAWDWIAEKLACTLMNTCYLLNPEAIIIGGGVAKAGDLLLTPLKQKLSASLSGPFWDDLKVLPAAFGHEAGMIGCAALSLEGL